MLLYDNHDNRFLNLSLDTFERSKISSIFKNALQEINDLHGLCTTNSRYYIEVEKFSKNPILKDKLQFKLYIDGKYLSHRLVTSHMNPYKCHIQYIMGYYLKIYDNAIIYKYMMLPLGKIRIKKFKVNISANYIL